MKTKIYNLNHFILLVVTILVIVVAFESQPLASSNATSSHCLGPLQTLSAQDLAHPNNNLHLVSGGRLKHGKRLNLLGEQGGAYHAKISVNGVVYNAVETVVYGHYIDLGWESTDLKRDQALVAAQMASNLSLSPKFYGYIDFRKSSRELIRYLYFEEFGSKNNVVIDVNGPLRGSWEIAKRIHGWLTVRLGEAGGKEIFNQLVKQYYELKAVHPDPHDENILLGLFRDDDQSYFILLQGVDWTHYYGYLLTNKTIPGLTKFSEKFIPIKIEEPFR